MAKPADKKNTPLISVVIPARNDADNLSKSLAALFAPSVSNSPSFEVLVVDDASTDDTAKVAGRFACRLIGLTASVGAGAARNRGVSEAQGEIILFIDADIIVKGDTLKLIADTFTDEADATAVVGMLDTKIPNKDIPSQYFNLRKHYDYLLIKGDLKNLYTSITAIKKDVFLSLGGFNENYLGASTEDAELGRRLTRGGKRITLNKNIRVQHLKKHSLFSLLKSDASRATHFMRLLLRERLAGSIVSDKRFVSFRLGSLLSVPLSAIIVISAVSAPYCNLSLAVLALSLILFLISNIGFLRFAANVTGPVKGIFIPLILFLDSLAVFLGLSIGMIGFVLGRRY